MLSTDPLSSFAPLNRSNNLDDSEKTPSAGSSVPAQETLKNTDSEMTLPLTTMDDQIKPKPGASSDKMSSFQSAKDRLDRLNRPTRSNGGGSAGPNNTNNNAIAASNWRSNTASGDVNMGGELDPFGRVISIFHGDHTIHVTSVSPGPVFPSKDQLTVAYGYAIRREDGTYTRLLRADELRGLNIGVPPTQEGAEGLIVLPSPDLPVPEKRVDPAQYVTAAVSGYSIYSSAMKATDGISVCQISSQKPT